MNTKIYMAGESVLDIVFNNITPTTANPGGSVLNTAVTLGRLGLKPILMTDFCNDKVGSIIKNFLLDNGVEPKQVVNQPNLKTSVALAFLDEDKNAEYQFFKTPPQECQTNLYQANFNSCDYFVTASYFAINSKTHPGIKKLIENANNANAIVVYDPNFRKAHLHEKKQLFEAIKYNIIHATIIKASKEDFELIFEQSDINKIFDIVLNLNPEVYLFLTLGAQGCIFMHKKILRSFNCKKIKPISTIGAGDNFTAGLIHGLINYKTTKDNILEITTDQQKLESIINLATDYAQRVCMSNLNYVEF